MSTATANLPAFGLPRPDVVLERIASVEEELKALRRLLRASTAAERAEEARRRRRQGQPEFPAGLPTVAPADGL
jgi:hypothetical protein